MNKGVKSWIITLSLSTLLSYLVIAFIELKLNPIEWSQNNRFGAVLIWVLASVFIQILVRIEIDK